MNSRVVKRARGGVGVPAARQLTRSTNRSERNGVTRAGVVKEASEQQHKCDRGKNEEKGVQGRRGKNLVSSSRRGGRG